jgi:hypothetical protein
MSLATLQSLRYRIHHDFREEIMATRRHFLAATGLFVAGAAQNRLRHARCQHGCDPLAGLS